ncbi:DUF1826 domain-containing protein [Paracraurococcus ruber]
MSKAGSRAAPADAHTAAQADGSRRPPGDHDGSGTGWRRSRAARPSGAAPACPSARLAIGAVAFLRGDRVPGNAGSGCIHRSPPAGPGDGARLRCWPCVADRKR